MCLKLKKKYLKRSFLFDEAHFNIAQKESNLRIKAKAAIEFENKKLLVIQARREAKIATDLSALNKAKEVANEKAIKKQVKQQEEMQKRQRKRRKKT